MGVSMKKFSRMTPEQRAKYRSNVIRMYRGQLLAHAIGMGGLCLCLMGLMIHHLITS